jgi:hypothetical protein
LNDNIIYFNCSGNQLKTLPKLPKKLCSLWCNNNKLIYLPENPYTIIEHDYSNNPYITKNIYTYLKLCLFSN